MNFHLTPMQSIDEFFLFKVIKKFPHFTRTLESSDPRTLCSLDVHLLQSIVLLPSTSQGIIYYGFWWLSVTQLSPSPVTGRFRTFPTLARRVPALKGFLM